MRLVWPFPMWDRRRGRRQLVCDTGNPWVILDLPGPLPIKYLDPPVGFLRGKGMGLITHGCGYRLGEIVGI